MPTPSYKIVKYDPKWPAIFQDEKARVAFVLDIDAQYIQHVGSTSVQRLGAKPIVDIMVGIPTMNKSDEYVRCLEHIGYEWRGETVQGTLYIRKAVPRRFNIHMTEYGGEFWVEHLLFRDYLRTHPEGARDYEQLKHELMATEMLFGATNQPLYKVYGKMSSGDKAYSYLGTAKTTEKKFCLVVLIHLTD